MLNRVSVRVALSPLQMEHPAGSGLSAPFSNSKFLFLTRDVTFSSFQAQRLPVICDTCGKETPIVSRVVIDKGYNRANARAIYNCPECFERKNRERSAQPEFDDAPAKAPESASQNPPSS